jgi:pyruvate, orthophosphate dikinase
VASPLGRWTLALDGGEPPGRDLVGGKAWSIAHIAAQKLDVPAAFVITTEACRAYLNDGDLPTGLDGEIAGAVAWLEQRTGRRFGGAPHPLLVSVRSGAPVSMPGMMDTVLNLGITDDTEAALARECGDAAFARDTHRRFLHLYAQIVLKIASPALEITDPPSTWRRAIREAAPQGLADDVRQQLLHAVRAVFDSWNSRRARRYREHHGIDHDIGTAVTVQAMVFGNMDERSGTGVLFSRNPLSGEPQPFGEYLARAQGEDVVSGRFTPRPLSSMSETVPQALQMLRQAAQRLERAGREVQDIEFTVERGRLFLLQARAAKLAPAAAVRAAVDMVAEGLIDEDAALGRLSPERIRLLLAPRLSEGAADLAERVARGEGACPGVGIGTVVMDSGEAERRVSQGEAVILARPTTSPEDLHGMIGASAVITEEGGSTSHAAVVSRALGIPCVVGCGPGSLQRLRGRTLTVDAASGSVYAGALEVVVPDERADPRLAQLTGWAQARSPLKILRPSQVPAVGIADLSHVPGAADPILIGSIVAGLRGAQGIRGGAAASREGIRAAIAAGLEFVVAEPVLPALLAAVHADLERRNPHDPDRGES